MWIQDLLKALIKAKALSEVVLHDCFANWHNIPRGFAWKNPPGRTPISLPRLRVLQLTAIPAQLASQLLAHLHVPNASRIDIQVDSANSAQAPYSLWDVLPANVADFSPTISLATSLHMELYRYYDMTAETAVRYLHVRAPLSGWHTVNVTHAFNGLLTASSGTPVSKHSLRVDAQTDVPWERIFRSWPTLEHIHGSFNTTFFSTLKTVSLPVGGQLCCPNLASVALSHYFAMEDGTCDLILDALRARAERGRTAGRAGALSLTSFEAQRDLKDA